MPYLGVFGLKFLKTKSLTNTMNFGIKYSVEIICKF